MKAVFLVGGPGSGKDIILKDIMYNYGLKEFTLEQINNVFNNPISENDKKYSLLKKESVTLSYVEPLSSENSPFSSPFTKMIL